MKTDWIEYDYIKVTSYRQISGIIIYIWSDRIASNFRFNYVWLDHISREISELIIYDLI